MRSHEHRSERHAALDNVLSCPPCTGLCNQGRTCSARLADFGIEGPYRAPRPWSSFRPLLCFITICSICVIASGWLVYARYFK